MPESNDGARGKLLLDAFDFVREMAVREKEYEDKQRDLLLGLVDVLDSFDRFLAIAEPVAQPTPEQGTQWRQTSQLINKQLLRVLRDAGVMPISCLGQAADPDRQEIVEVCLSTEMADGIIVKELCRGYEWRGQPLRLPRVIVAAFPERENQ
jgi:molecular chaperone GrpE